MSNKIEYIQGINGDRLEINGQTYAYGYNCSFTRALARCAEKNYNDAIKYKWKNPYSLQPFIGDILEDICPDWRTIEWTGKNIFANRPLTTDELNKVKERIVKEYERS